MRVSKEKAAHNRERILTSAARLFREQGIAGTGVDAITDDAGLTHGGLYSQFGSKEAIAAEAIRFALARGNASGSERWNATRARVQFPPSSRATCRARIAMRPATAAWLRRSAPTSRVSRVAFARFLPSRLRTTLNSCRG